MAEMLGPREGRQGERGKPVLWVLVTSLALLAIASIGLLTWNGGGAPRDYAGRDRDASRGDVLGSVAESSPPGGPGMPVGDPQPARPETGGRPR